VLTGKLEMTDESTVKMPQPRSLESRMPISIYHPN
jgi:hypothetical protein